MKIPQWPETMQTSVQATIAQTDSTNALGFTGGSDRVIVRGPVAWADGQTHTCTAVRWRSGTSTSPVFTLRAGFRDLDLTNGPPGRDDGADDGNSGTHANPASTTNFTTTLGTPRSIAHNEVTTLVFDTSAYTSGSTRSPQFLTAQAYEHGSFVTFYNGTGATYALAAGSLIPAITLVADDGTVGRFLCGIPCLTASVTTVTFANDDTPDERALSFTLRQLATRIDFVAHFTTVAGGDVDFVLYRSTTAVGTRSVDANTWDANAAARYIRGSFVGNFEPGTYHLAFKPTSTTDVTFGLATFAAGDQLAMGSDLLGYSTRTDAGAWTTVDTNLPMGVSVDPTIAHEIPAGAYSLSGTVELDNVAVASATVRVIDRTTGLTKSTTTNGSGAWSMSVHSNTADRYAAMVEYESGGNHYSDTCYFELTAA